MGERSGWYIWPRAHAWQTGSNRWENALGFYFHWIESTAFSTWLRESPSLLAIPTVLLLHTLGMGFLAGTNAAIGLRLLGVASQMRIAPMQTFYPLMWSGFWINAVTGVVLVIAYPTQALTNPVFYIKLTLIGLAVVNARTIRNEVFRDPHLDERPVPRRWKILAGASLFFWAGAIVSGRMLPFTSSQMLTQGY